MASDIANFVFNDILRASNLYTGDIGHDFIFNLIIPSAVFLLIWFTVVGKITEGHSALKLLFGIGALGSVVYLNMFELLAGWSKILFFIWIGFALVNTAYKKTVGETGHGALMAGAGWLGKKLKRKIPHMDASEKILMGNDARALVASVEGIVSNRRLLNNPTTALNNYQTQLYRESINKFESRASEMAAKLATYIDKHGADIKKDIDKAIKDSVDQKKTAMQPAEWADLQATVRSYWPY